MALLTGCLDAELADIDIKCTGASRFGRFQRDFFQQIYKADGSKNFFDPNHATTPTNPTLLATWSALIAKSDQEKVITGSNYAESVLTAGEQVAFGGGNVLPNRVSMNMGSDPSTFTSMLIDANQTTIIKPLRGYQKSNGIRPNLGNFHVNQFGQIGMISNGLAGTELKYYPIPMYKIHVGDPSQLSDEEPTKNAFSYMKATGWADMIVWITPTDFDALELGF